MRFPVGAAVVTLSLLALLVLASCLPVGLGDPEKSKAQEKYASQWTWETAQTRHLVMLEPWDARTYAMRLITVSSRPGEKRAEDGVLKAWLTDIDGQTLMTLEAIPGVTGETSKSDKRFLVLKLNLTGDRLIATTINPSFPPFESVVSSEELERLIRQHLDNPAAWAEEAISAHRASAEEVKAILAEANRAIADNLPG